jgi:hypothetical protein
MKLLSDAVYYFDVVLFTILLAFVIEYSIQEAVKYFKLKTIKVPGVFTVPTSGYYRIGFSITPGNGRSVLLDGKRIKDGDTVLIKDIFQPDPEKLKEYAKCDAEQTMKLYKSTKKKKRKTVSKKTKKRKTSSRRKR